MARVRNQTGTPDTSIASQPEADDPVEAAPAVDAAGLDPEKGIILNLNADIKAKGVPNRKGDQIAIVFLADDASLNLLGRMIQDRRLEIIEPKRNGVTVD